MLAASEMTTHLYNTLVFVHVLCAIIWVGGAFTTQFFAVAAIRSGGAEAASFAKRAEWVGKRVFMPASVILLLAGLWMVFGFEFWSIMDIWVLIGLGGIAFSIAVGMGFIGPESGRIGSLIETKGADDPEVTERIRRIFTISRIELAILIIVVWDMTYKPFA